MPHHGDMTTADLTTQTPVEIDTQIAALWQERYKQQALASRQWDSVVFHVSEVLHHQGTLRRFAKATATQVREFLSEHSEISESEEMQAEAYEQPWITSEAVKAWDAYLKYLDYSTAADEILFDVEPLDAEWERRGRWTRAYLVVTKGTGHVHRSMNCTTCYPTTQYHWMVDWADKDEAQIVADAGERACTVCYPSAPVDAKGTRMFSPDEVEAQKRREEREQKRQEREAAQITVNVLEYSSTTPTEKVFKSERAVTNYIADKLGSLAWYGTTHPTATRWLHDVEACREALAAKGIDYDYDKALAAARKKVTREGGQAKY